MKKLNIFIFTIIILFFLNTGAYAQDRNFYIFLCFGQSNMQGAGPLESQDMTVNNRFKVFQAQDCTNVGRKKAKWYSAVPPSCHCTSGLSPADCFGKTLVDNLPDNITVLMESL